MTNAEKKRNIAEEKSIFSSFKEIFNILKMNNNVSNNLNKSSLSTNSLLNKNSLSTNSASIEQNEKIEKMQEMIIKYDINSQDVFWFDRLIDK